LSGMLEGRAFLLCQLAMPTSGEGKRITDRHGARAPPSRPEPAVITIAGHLSGQSRPDSPGPKLGYRSPARFACRWDSSISDGTGGKRLDRLDQPERGQPQLYRVILLV
jgi:hypothetical protein